MSSTNGLIFRIHTWGESHGGAVGVMIDGCPAQLPLDVAEIQVELDQRRPGQSRVGERAAVRWRHRRELHSSA